MSFDDDNRDAGGELSVIVRRPEVNAGATSLRDFPGALATIAHVLKQNRHRGAAWRHETVFSHTRHAVAHLDSWREQRATEDLEHALVRVAMAVELALATNAETATHRLATTEGEGGQQP
jgi:hypothetical protein